MLVSFPGMSSKIINIGIFQVASLIHFALKFLVNNEVSEVYFLIKYFLEW